MRPKTFFAALALTLATTASFAQQPVQIAEPHQFGQLPLTFEVNQGQSAPQVRFLSRGNGYTAFLTLNGVVLTLRRNDTSGIGDIPSSASRPAPSASSVLQFSLVGAAANPAVIGEDLQPGRVNYFIGNDKTKWRTNVATYGKVRYKNVYPGIDLVYYGNHRQLEYDFEIQPTADPRRIQFAIQGANSVDVDEKGNLVLTTATGDALHFQTPLVFQISNGQRVQLSGGYVMKDDTHVGFQLGGYDPTKPLVIDPVLVYSTYLGGDGDNQPTGIAVDSSGCTYVVGYTNSNDFPLATLGSLAPNTDHVFVAKLDATGSNLIYADYIGGNNQDFGTALVLDSADQVYLTGSTESSNFPTVNAYQAQQPGPFAGFVSQISADGSTLLYSTYFGGGNYDEPTNIGLDGSGDMYVAGETMSQNFPVVNAYQASVLPNQGGVYGTYGFLSKFNASGSALVYSTYLAGNTNVSETCGSSTCWPAPYSGPNTLAVDSNGNSYLAGITNTYNFPVNQGAYLTTDTAPQNAYVGFVSKLSSSGGLDYSTYFYGSSGNPVSIASIAVDSTGAAYITGSAQSDGTFPITTTSICNPSSAGTACGYGFVTKFDPSGATLLYSTFLGPNNYATPQSIVLDASNDAYVATNTQSDSYQLTDPIESYAGNWDLLLVEIDPTGTSELFSTYLGGSESDSPASMVLDASGNLYVLGSTESTDFPVTAGVFQSQLAATWDGFISKIASNSAPSVALSPSSVQFAPVQVGSSSQPQSVLLRNMGSAALTIQSITASGDFGETNNCGSSVPAAGSCTFSITFTPAASGAKSGSVVIDDDAAGSPHSMPLYGVGEGGSGPAAAFTPGALTFSSVPVGRSGIAQTVTLTNAGNASFNVTAIQTSGDFSQTNNCGSSISAGSSCSISVVFTPTAAGSRSGSLTVTDSAPGSPQSVNLSGIGAAANLVFSPSPVTFPNVLLGTSASQAVTLANSGNAPIDVNSIQITGVFTQTNNCPGLLNGGASCTINVSFTPSSTATNTGSLSVFYGGQNALLSTGVSGNGGIADLVVTPTIVAFSSVALESSSSQTVTLTNTGNGLLTINNLQITGNFKQTNTCGATLTGHSSCAVTVVFAPTATGSSNGSFTVTDSAGSPKAVTLSGTGVDFTLTTTTSSNTIQPGATATYTLTAAAVGGAFSNAVSLGCTGLPAQATCSFSPSSVTPGATKAATTLTIATTSSIAENMPAVPVRQQPMNRIWMQLQGIGVIGMVLAGRNKRSKRTSIFILLLLMVLGMVFMSGCAGGTGIAPVPQSYTITVTGTSGSLQHSVPITLTVQ